MSSISLAKVSINQPVFS